MKQQRQAATLVTAIVSIFVFLSMICIVMKLVGNINISMLIGAFIAICIIVYISFRIRIDIDEIERHEARNRQLKYENDILRARLEAELRR